jgi:hypothetical protein
MALPKIGYPTFELILPSTKETVKYRPFLVKEEKILLTSQASGEANDIINAVKQVINNCILTDKINVDGLTTFDLEYLFIKIRAKSVNNVINLTYRDMEDDQKYMVEINLDEVEIKEDPNHVTKFDIGNGYGLVMKYPRADLTNSLKFVEGEMDAFFEVLKSSIDSVYDAESVYKLSDSTPEEVDEFIQSLDTKAFKKIQDFYSTMPKLFYEVKYTNSLGNEKVIPLTSLTDFFTLG